MASVVELANLANMVYDGNSQRFRSWERLRSYGKDSGKGFYAQLYTNKVVNQAVLAIRGTELKDRKDLASDAQIAIGLMPTQYKDAEDAYNSAIVLAEKELRKGYAFILTGHSLGGGLAAALSAKKGGVPVVTFNAPGMLSSLISDNVGPFGSIDTSRINTANMFHYRATFDPISKASGPQIGRVYNVFVSTHVNFSMKEALVPFVNIGILSGKIGLAQHSMANMVKELESRPSCREPIVFKKTKDYELPRMPAPAMA